MNTGRSLTVWMASAILSTIFVLCALPKLIGLDLMAEAFEAWQYPVAFMYVVGLFEVAGAMLILIPTAARFGYAILIFVMCGAIITHLMSGEIAIAVLPLALLVVLAIVANKDKREQETDAPSSPVTGTA